MNIFGFECRYKKLIMSNKALIFGGYGNFGKLISRALLKSNIPIILAGRNAARLEQSKQNLEKEFPLGKIESEVKDINEDLVDFLRKKKPKVLVNTCGPFQTANYQVVENCITTHTNYIDLADGRDFVVNMKKHHSHALRNHTTIITGASSVPGLSSAVIEEFKGQFSTIQKIRYGISPGQRTTRGGSATVKGVLGYVGKPIKPFGSLEKAIYGWQDLHRVNYPGGIGSRLFGNCQIPDLDLFPHHYGVQDIRFSAGMESKLLHLLIWFTSWLVRLRLMPINLTNHSQLLLKLSHFGFDWLGTDEGGMHMIITGKDQSGKMMERKWYIIVRKGQGPNVPAMPSIILAKKICQQRYSLAGVHPCMGLVTLSEYLDGLKEMSMETYTQKNFI